MTRYEQVQQELNANPRRWLVTGAAGFIGSHLVEKLLQLGQSVVGLDNYSTGKVANLLEVRRNVGEKWKNYTEISGDIRYLSNCQKAVSTVDLVLHQAARCSVPASIKQPIATHKSNVTGFLNMLVAARDAKIQRFIFASSSAIYGDEDAPVKREEQMGRPLSPYAVSKTMDEQYAQVFAQCYQLPWIALRYFNVFGPRQDPKGPYAAVISRWIQEMLRAKTVKINGDGAITRDFCYVANVVQANILAATAPDAANERSYNIATGRATSLLQLYAKLAKATHTKGQPKHLPPRPGDIQHSLADITSARKQLGYSPTHTLEEGIKATIAWYKKHN